MALADLLRVLLVMLLWGMNFVSIRIGLNGFPPLLLCAMRFFFSGFPAIFFFPRPKVPWRLLLGYGLTSFGFQFGLLFSSMALGVTPGLASLLLQLQGFFTISLAAWIFREKISSWKLVGALISFTGVAYVAFFSNGSLTPLGLTLTLLAALSWSAGNIFAKRIGQTASLSLVIWGSFIAFPFLTLLSFAIEGPTLMMNSLIAISWTSIFALIYIVLFSTYVGYALWIQLLNKYPTSTVVPFTLLVPVFGFLGSFLFLNEPFPPWKLVGSVLVILGLCFNLLETKIKAFAAQGFRSES